MKEMRSEMVGKGRWILLGTLVLASCTLGCLAPEGDHAGEEEMIGVIVSIVPQAELVERVGGEHVRVTVMVPPGASPHTYEPTAGQLRAVSNAELYALVGSGIEFERVWFDKIRTVNREMLVVDCSRGITLIGADHECSEGEVEHEHTGADPHIWLSPLNAMIMVGNICDGLIEIDPEHEADYIANRDRYLQELVEVDAFIHEQLDPYRTHRAFLTYHPSFGYFAAEYNLTQIAIEHGGKAPTPQVIQASIDYAERYNLSYVYVAPQFATRDAGTIAQEINGAVIYLDPLPRDYSATMRSIATSLARELE